MWDLKACRCCLATEPKLEKISETLCRLYCTVTGLMFNPGDGYPNYFCVECHTHLKKCLGFRRKSRRAFFALQTIMNAKEQITIEDIQQVDRKQNNLMSSLGNSQPNKYHSFIMTSSTIEEEVPKILSAKDFYNEIQNTSLFSTMTEPTFKSHEPSFTDHVYDIIDINGEKPEFPIESIELESQPIIEEEVPIQDETIKEEIPIDMEDVFKDLGDDNINNDYDESDATNLNEEIQDNNSTEEDAKEDIDKNKTALNKKGRKAKKEEMKKHFRVNLFTKIKLSLEEQKEEIHKRKDSLNFKNSPFKCMDCFKGFVDEKAYSTHRLRHSDESGLFACTLCNVRFKTQLRANIHKRDNHSTEYRCNQCSFTTRHRQSARLHEGWHSGKKYNCPQCSDVFMKFTTYMGHLRIKHPSDFVCELCGYAFVNVKGIERHKILKHMSSEKVPEDGPYCETCDVRFISEDAFNTHLKVSARHKNDQNYVQYRNQPKQLRGIRRKKSDGEQVPEDGLYCESCDVRFISEDVFNRHSHKNDSNQNHGQYRQAAVKSRRRKAAVKSIRSKKSKDEQDPGYSLQDLTCEQCGMQMTDSRAYHHHFRKMHPDKNRTLYPSMKAPFMCDKCGQFFQSSGQLKDHFHSHTNERRFKCPQCEKTFRMKLHLTTHMSVHKKQRYPCNICEKSLSTAGNRLRHIFLHTGLRPHTCEMCSKTFKSCTEKKYHIDYVHLKKPWPKRIRKRRASDKQGQNMQSTQGVSETDKQTLPPCDKLDLNMISD